MRNLLRLIKQGLFDLTVNPWAQVLTLTAITLVAFMVGVFLMAVVTLNHHLSVVRGETVFQLYWQPNIEQGSIDKQWQEIRSLSGFTKIKTYTPAEALKEMQKSLAQRGNQQSIHFLSRSNPLPATALLTFVPHAENYEQWFNKTNNYLRKLPGIERISSSPLRDELGQAWRSINNFVLRPIIIFLTLLLGLIVGNTVRLALLAKSQEVEILKLVGAFNWYIRLPLLVCGAMQGFLGSALALLVLKLMHMQIYNVLNFPPLLMEIKFLPPDVIALMLIVPMVMGVVGGWVGMKH